MASCQSRADSWLEVVIAVAYSLLSSARLSSRRAAARFLSQVRKSWICSLPWLQAPLPESSLGTNLDVGLVKGDYSIRGVAGAGQLVINGEEAFSILTKVPVVPPELGVCVARKAPEPIGEQTV